MYIKLNCTRLIYSFGAILEIHICTLLKILTFKAPIRTAADDIHHYFFHCFSEKIRLDVSSESSARQWIHMKNQALSSSKDKSKTLKCPLLQFLFGALRLKEQLIFSHRHYFNIYPVPWPIN